MYIKIGTTIYRGIRNLSFSPNVDITCQQIPSNQIVVDVITSDVINVKAAVELYDEDDSLWAKYYVYTADRISKNIIHVVARDLIWMLDSRRMSQSFYNNELVSTIFARILKSLTDTYGSGIYQLDNAFSATTVTGYFPQGSARSRLQMLCFVIGAYVDSSGDKIKIKQFSKSSPKTLTTDDMFYKPELEYNDYVSAIRCRYCAYSQIATKDDNVEWVEVNGNYYQKKELEIVVYNPDLNIPTEVSNEISISDIGVLNKDNVIATIARLAEQYFYRRTLSASIINDGDYSVGDYIYGAPTGITGTAVNGYISSVDYKFGNEARSDIVIKNLQLNTGTITLYYYGVDLVTVDFVPLETYTFTLPENVHITFENPFFETASPHAVYFVEANNTELDIMYGGSETVACETASYLKSDGTLVINQVDEAVFQDGTLMLYGGGYVS